MTTSPAHDPGLGSIRERLQRDRAGLIALLPTAETPVELDDSGVELGRRHAAILDALVAELFAQRVRADDARAVAVAGVGAYGRGALALHSDLDLRILASDADVASRVADALLYPLWDLGVAVGHQVVAAADLLRSARDDLPSATSLLDWRHVAGDAGLSRALLEQARAGLFAMSEVPAFTRRLEREVSERHLRFGGSVYLLEPDVKNGPGALRDLDVARWAAVARYGAGELASLVRVGAIVPREALEIREAAELLFRVRNLLHAHAGRRSDRLTFDEQEVIAALFGLGNGPEAVEHLMSSYYRAARIIQRARDTILTRATPSLSRRRPHAEDLPNGVRVFDGQVSLIEPERLSREPALALRVVACAVERGLPILPYAREVIGRAAADPSFAAALREDAEAARRFVELASTAAEAPLRAGTVARELHDLGLILAMIPEFSPVVGRVHHDLYHVYTVDVHSVAAVDRLAQLARGELAADFAVASRLAAEMPRPRVLFFATLLHDVGKAIGGKDHSVRGADMAGPILARLGFEPEDVEAAQHLIRQHLAMYHAATRRDLDDPSTIEEFAREVRGRAGLCELYLLTIADLSTTSPTSLTSWKARMLDELFLRTEELLSGAQGRDGRASEARRAALDGAAAMPARSEADRSQRVAFVHDYLASMPERYVLANAPEAIAAHAEVARLHAERMRRGDEASVAPASVALVPSRHPEAAELCVIASDRPGLLAAITAAIAASRLEVHAAQIHSRVAAEDPRAPTARGGGRVVEAVDLFWVRDRADGVSGVARTLPKLVADLNALLRGEKEATEIARRRGPGPLSSRRTPRVRTQVAIDDRTSATHTILEITTHDRPGLLFAIADALYRLGLSIAVAKINTEGSRIADVFYVSEANGAKVAPGTRAQAIREALLAAVGDDEPGPERASAPPRV